MVASFLNHAHLPGEGDLASVTEAESMAEEAEEMLASLKAVLALLSD